MEYFEMVHKPQRHETMKYGGVKLYAGRSCPELSQKIADYLKIPLQDREVFTFPNDNIFVKLNSSVRGQDCYVIQTSTFPVHTNLMELLIMIQTLRLDSAARITAVIPYLCYSRSDKKDQPRVPITARLVADMIEVAGADRYMTLDLHAGQIQGFFSIPGDVLTSFHLLIDYAKTFIDKLIDPVVASADLGFAKKARNFAEELNVPLAFVEKRRITNMSGASQTLSLIGDTRNRDVILVDDEISTGGSIEQAVNIIKECGARDIYVIFVHPVFSMDAARRMAALPIKQFITTDTIPIPPEKAVHFGDRIKIITVAELLGEVIIRANEGRSVGEMFNE
jgi:ribose-phosphate pyrophosphokinase